MNLKKLAIVGFLLRTPHMPSNHFSMDVPQIKIEDNFIHQAQASKVSHESISKSKIAGNDDAFISQVRNSTQQEATLKTDESPNQLLFSKSGGTAQKDPVQSTSGQETTQTGLIGQSQDDVAFRKDAQTSPEKGSTTQTSQSSKPTYEERLASLRAEMKAKAQGKRDSTPPEKTALKSGSSLKPLYLPERVHSKDIKRAAEMKNTKNINAAQSGSSKKPFFLEEKLWEEKYSQTPGAWVD